MKLGLIIVVALLLVLLLFGGKVVGTRNQLVQEREQIRATWAQVDTDIQRRAELIPNLVNTVIAYAAHEKGVLDDNAAARAGLMNAKTPQEGSDQSNPETYGNYIDGQWVKGPTFENRNPANTDEAVGLFVKASASDVEAAADAAEKALAGWSSLPAPARGNFLFKVADILDRKFEA